MNWLKTRRQELELSQEEMTARLQVAGINITRSAYSAWETGRNKPPLEEEKFREGLAQALRLSTQELLARAGFSTTPNSTQSREAEIAARLIDRMKPEDRDKAIRILEALAE